MGINGQLGEIHEWGTRMDLVTYRIQDRSQFQTMLITSCLPSPEGQIIAAAFTPRIQEHDWAILESSFFTKRRLETQNDVSLNSQDHTVATPSLPKIYLFVQKIYLFVQNQFQYTKALQYIFSKKLVRLTKRNSNDSHQQQELEGHKARTRESSVLISSFCINIQTVQSLVTLVRQAIDTICLYMEKHKPLVFRKCK